MSRAERWDALESDDVSMRIPRRRIDDRQNPLEFYTNVEFKKRFRFSKSTTLFLLQVLEISCGRLQGIPAVYQLLACLRFFATGHFQVSDGDLLKFSQSTVCRFIKKISIAIAEKLPLFIKFPTAHEEIVKAKVEFGQISGLSGIVGAIDCSHIPIASPGSENAELYRNRKGYFSLNVQYSCDANMKFTDVVARWPGSVHDSRIFSNSLICQKLNNGSISGILVGDRGYPCQPYLFTPVRHPTSSAERQYNSCQVKTRQVIERSFGILKQRFRCLRIPLRTKLSTSMTIIVATACLHNLARIHNEDEWIDT